MSSNNSIACWKPSEQRKADAKLTAFIDRYRSGASYSELHSWSVAKPDEFWSAVWEFAGIIGTNPDPACVPQNDMRKTRFFPDAKLNYAENLLRGSKDRIAVIEIAEDGSRRELSMQQLCNLTASWKAALADAGVGRSDCVAAIVPNTIDAIAAMLATQALGAIWSSCAPEFGPDAIADRFGQVQPKILIATEGYRFKGKLIDRRAQLAETFTRLPNVEKIIMLPQAGLTEHACLDRCVPAADFLATHASAKLEFAPCNFDDIGFILFSSGTTGLPKCIAHSAGGILLKSVSEYLLHADIHPGDRLFFFTTCSWMMWNWLVTALAAEATVVLFDGQPMYPDPARLIDIAQDEQVTHFGASAKYYDALSKAGVNPAASHDIKSLRTIFSTGSPLLHETFDYLYAHWKQDLHVASISGGTDICACFMGGVPTLPVYRGEIQASELGCDCAVYSAAGKPVVNEPGELVCRNAIPSMPVKFWGDEDGKRYQKAYYERFAGIWHHGDWLTQTDSGGFVIAGRSDATLNPGGVRIGSAEIYRQIEAFAEIADAAAVGQSWQGDERIVLFIVLAEGYSLTDELVKKLEQAIRAGATPRHVPAAIIAVADLPRTHSGKIAELAIRNVIHGQSIENVSALANPQALKLFEGIAELA